MGSQKYSASHASAPLGLLPGAAPTTLAAVTKKALINLVEEGQASKRCGTDDFLWRCWAG